MRALLAVLGWLALPFVLLAFGVIYLWEVLCKLRRNFTALY